MANILFYLQGDVIQAIAHNNKDWKFVESRINLMLCYKIENYVCVPTDQFINVLPHPVNIRIGCASSITPVADTETLPRQYFNFYIHENLEPLRDTNEQVVGNQHYYYTKV